MSRVSRVFAATAVVASGVLVCGSRVPAEARSNVLASQNAAAIDTRAESADRAWLALVDAAKYNESWKSASPAFQAAIPEAKWESALQGVRGPLGKLVSRKLQATKFATSLPGAPDGEYIVTTYVASFEHKSEAVETVTATHEKDGSWRVSGYFIK